MLSLFRCFWSQSGKETNKWKNKQKSGTALRVVIIKCIVHSISLSQKKTFDSTVDISKKQTLWLSVWQSEGGSQSVSSWHTLPAAEATVRLLRNHALAAQTRAAQRLKAAGLTLIGLVESELNGGGRRERLVGREANVVLVFVVLPRLPASAAPQFSLRVFVALLNVERVGNVVVPMGRGPILSPGNDRVLNKIRVDEEGGPAGTSRVTR